MTTRRTITDAAALKALAHPLRMDLLESLLVDGPGTATQLAERLGDSPSNCSWHLRKLAEHGFVTEVEGATGRSRPWQAASEGLSWGKGEIEPETSAAGHGLTEMMLGRELQRLRDAHAREASEPQEWRDAVSVMQSALWLTPQEAKEIATRLEELFLTHFDRLRRPELRPEGARLVSLVGWLVPRRQLADETPGESGAGDIAPSDAGAGDSAPSVAGAGDSAPAEAGAGAPSSEGRTRTARAATAATTRDVTDRVKGAAADEDEGETR